MSKFGLFERRNYRMVLRLLLLRMFTYLYIMAKLEIEVKMYKTVWYYIAVILSILNSKGLLNKITSKNIFYTEVAGQKTGYNLNDFKKENPDLF